MKKLSLSIVFILSVILSFGQVRTITGTGTTGIYPKFTGSTTIGNALLKDSTSTWTVAKNIRLDGLKMPAGAGAAKVLTSDANGVASWATPASLSLTGSTGDLISFSATDTKSNISAVSAGSYLRSNGTSTLPLWSTLKLPNTATQYYIPLTTSSNTIGETSLLNYNTSTNSLGVNQTAPGTNFFYKTAVFGNNTDVTQGITIMGGATKYAGIGFAKNVGSGTDGYRGEIAYNHSTNYMYLATAAAGSTGYGFGIDASNYSYVPKGLTIGSSSATPVEFLYIKNDNPARTGTLVENANTGASAYVSTRVSNGTNKGYYGITSINFSQASYNLKDMVFLESEGVNGLAICALRSTGNVIFVSGGNQTANITAKLDSLGNFGLGYQVAKVPYRLSVKNGNIAITDSARTYYQHFGSTNDMFNDATLSSGTVAVTISGLLTTDRAYVQLTTPSGTLGTHYKAVCTANTLTITAVDTGGSTVTTDTSTLTYHIIRKSN